MLLWETQITYKDKKTRKAGSKHLIVSEDVRNPQQAWDDIIRELNRLLGHKCDAKGLISVYIYDGREGCLEAIIAYPIQKSSLEYCFNHIKALLEDNFAVREVAFKDYREIPGKRFDELGDRADENSYVRRWFVERKRLGLNYFSNSSFSVEESVNEQAYGTLEDARKAADAIMADDSFIEELKRIYSEENEKRYLGNPVHYKIVTSNLASSKDVTDILIGALRANKRICGNRIVRIHDISEDCHNESELEHLFASAQGNVVIIEMSGTDEDHGNYASSYQRVVDFFCSVISKYHMKTLCLFLEDKQHPGFSDHLIAKMKETLQIIDINEGYGDREQAKTYLKSLAAKEDFDIDDAELEDALDNKKMFSVEEISEIYSNFFKNGLRTHVYKAYSEYTFEKGTTEKYSSAPYDELMRMIGLSEIKQVVDEIIDGGKMRKLRSSMGLDTYKASLHMVFTGNPGSAKTTVARLIAQILRKENILDNGSFVECGRADLIAKYVGWTARQVRAKFREAKGGILFIDEAYSLVDDSRSFADEAINTIVQEMENHREDVIVIFAGYPEKMKDFLNKNEGLKSRIAFHLDFPDYTVDEMVDILKLMADKQGFRLNSATLKKCRFIFEKTCTEEDFGNGRFVRNLLEQAVMAQSHRLAKEYKGEKITRRTLQTLKADDFDVNISERLIAEKIPIGFCG